MLAHKTAAHTGGVAGGVAGGGAPEKHEGPGALPWIMAFGGGSLALVLGTTGTLSYLYALGSESELNQALLDYSANDNAKNRKALAEAGRAADDASVVNNCLLVPLGCLCIPLGGVAAWGTYWGVTADGGDE